MKYKVLILLILLLALVGCTDLDTKEYSVVFMDGNDYLETRLVKEFESVTPPVAPDKDGYIFLGWDKDLSRITENIMVFAIYEKIEKYEVKFLVDGVVIKTETVEKGKSATNPSNPTKEGYNFIGWDKEFNNITSNLEVNAKFQEVVEKFEVKFLVDGVVIKTETVEKGKSAKAPNNPVKDGYKFVGWDKEFTNITSNLEVNAVFEEIVIKDRIKYTSYVDSFTYEVINSPKDFIGGIDFSNSLKQTITSVKNGGSRGTDQIVVYNQSNLVNRNMYGFEIGVNSDGVAITKETLTTMPSGGFIISAHGKGIDIINKINIGDIVIFDTTKLEVKVYFDSEKSAVIGLYSSIIEIIDRVEIACGKLLALDYQTIVDKINDSILLYNNLLVTYDKNKLNEVQGLLLDVEFLLVEQNSMQIKAFWHYPLRSSDNFKERNKQEVIEFLTEAKKSGFNWIFLNTNFSGKSVYKSKYLVQSLTTNYTYGEYKDYLECFITEAHKLGIKVSAWTNTLIIGDGSYNNTYKSEWYQKGYQNENNHNGMYFIDISNTEARSHLKNVFTELSGYDLDGIEFDFIRYPSGNLRGKGDNILSGSDSILDWGYTDSFINLFKQSYPFTGDLKQLILTDITLRKQWLDFKENLLTETVKMLVETIREVNPDTIISAAVMSSISTAKNTYLQNWELWVNKGYLDMLEPMVYSGDANYVYNQVIAMNNLINSKAEITAGIFPEDNGALSGMNAIQIGTLTESSLIGFSKFSSKVIFKNSNLMHAFSQMNREYTTVFNDDILTIFNSYVYDLLDKVENYYKYVNSDYDYTNLLNVLSTSYSVKNVNLIDENFNNILLEINKINNTTIKTKLSNMHKQIEKYL